LSGQVGMYCTSTRFWRRERRAQAASDPYHPAEKGGDVNSPSTTGDGDLSVDLGRRLDAVCDRFEDAWQAGQAPRIEDYLAGWKAADRVALLRELVALELECRRSRGEPAQPAEYVMRLPELDLAWLAKALKPTGAEVRSSFGNAHGAPTVVPSRWVTGTD
jgi:hypothetical protein